MSQAEPSICARAPGHGRAALLCAALAFLVGQAALGLALHRSWRVRDPEYGMRSERLRARLAERAPGRPLVVVLGTSRAAMGVRPGLLPANHRPGGPGPVVFNAGLVGAGSLLDMLCLRRLLAEGFRPDCVLIEVWPWSLSAGTARQLASIPPERLAPDDWTTLRPLGAEPGPNYYPWWHECVPCLSYRTTLLNQLAPSWVIPDKRQNENWNRLDEWGWLRRPTAAESRTGDRAFMNRLRAAYAEHLNHFAASDDARRTYAELFDLCRREKIAAALFIMPDYFLPDYDPASRAAADEFLRRLSREHDLPLVDARDWASPDQFCEGVHLTHAGAAAFTERFGREVVQPYLDGESLSRLWPPGSLNTAPRRGD